MVSGSSLRRLKASCAYSQHELYTVEALQGSRSLRTLDISRNRYLRGIKSVAVLLNSTSLRDLNLSHQVIDEGQFVDLSAIVGALGSTQTLKSLDLGFNQLDDGAMPFLAAALSCNSTIKYVSLRGNKFSNTGISILASKLPSMHGLEHLVLTENNFGGNGMGQLKRSLQLNYSIMRLDLDVAIPHHVSCMYFPDLNWMRRRFLFEAVVTSAALWPLLLQRANQLINEINGAERRANVVFCILKKSTALFPF